MADDTGAARGDLVRAVTGWARRREDVRAVVLVGSRARTDVPADAWSDHDFVVVVDDDEPFIAEGARAAGVGPVALSFVEAAAAGALRERRILFADGADADFAFIPVDRLAGVLARPDVAAVFARGFRVLLDDQGMLGALPTTAPAPPDDLAGLVHEFWHRAIWTARKLRRGEVHVAAHGCNCGLRVLLRRVLEIEARAAGRDTWHQGRFFERWADPHRRSAMAATVATDDAATTAAAIRAACALFDDVCAGLEARHGLRVALDRATIERHLDAALGDSR